MEKFNYDMDERFFNYFNKRVRQVFFYTTNCCQLRCKQCLYKPDLTFQMGKKEIDKNVMLELGEDFYKMGAKKATVMGGEPAMYGSEDHKDLVDLITGLKNIGYEYVRMDTNGIYDDDMLAIDGMKKLDEVSFSLDGHTSEINNWVRGEGAYDKCVKNIKRALELGYKVDITACVHKKLAEKDEKGIYQIVNMIKWAESIGVEEINFHVLFKHGFPMDTWTEDTAITPNEWLEIKDVLYELVYGENSNLKIHVRIPEHFVTKEEFEDKPKFYGYCPVKLGERILVHPDGQLRICSGLISSKYCIAKYLDDKRIIWEEGQTNEICDHNCNGDTPCTNQSKSMNCGEGLVPLCFSFKPLQKEFVWKKKLNWDEKKNI